MVIYHSYVNVYQRIYHLFLSSPAEPEVEDGSCTTSASFLQLCTSSHPANHLLTRLSSCWPIQRWSHNILSHIYIYISSYIHIYIYTLYVKMIQVRLCTHMITYVIYNDIYIYVCVFNIMHIPYRSLADRPVGCRLMDRVYFSHSLMTLILKNGTLVPS